MGYTLKTMIMKEKIAHIIGGLIIYFIGGCLIVFVADKDMENKWQFIASWTVFMTLFEIYVFQPLRKKLKKRKEQRQHE